jgi:hypothetical protein
MAYIFKIFSINVISLFMSFYTMCVFCFYHPKLAFYSTIMYIHNFCVYSFTKGPVSNELLGKVSFPRISRLHSSESENVSGYKEKHKYAWRGRFIHFFNHPSAFLSFFPFAMGAADKFLDVNMKYLSAAVKCRPRIKRVSVY